MTQNCLPLGSLVVTFSPPKALPLESRTRLCPCWQAPQASCSSGITLGPPLFPSELSQLTQRGAAAVSHPSCQARQRSRPLLSLLGLLGRGCVQGGLGFRLCTQEQRQRVLCAELPALGGPTWQGGGDRAEGLQAGVQQEAGAFGVHVLPTGFGNGWAAGLRAEACVDEGVPRTLPPPPPPAPAPSGPGSSLKKLLGPRKTHQQ